jgi:hypothetical protein
VVLDVVEDRGELAMETIKPKILAAIDVEFWQRFGGPAADWLDEELLALGAQRVAAE